MSILLQDFRFSLRTLRKSPGFAFTAILTLALGIGAVTSVFSVVNAVLLKPFDFPQPDRLVVLRETASEFKGVALPANYRHYQNWKANAKSLQDAAAFRNNNVSVASGHAGGSDHPQIVGGLSVTPNFFSVLGVAPMMGRAFLPGEAIDGHDNVVILSWNAWQKYFNGSSDVIGQTLSEGGEKATVVGVLPRGFSFPHMDEMQQAVAQREVRGYEVFTPLVIGANQMSDSGDYNYLVIGRLKQGVRLKQAESELGGLQTAFFHAAHLSFHPWILVEPLNQEVAGSVDTGLWLLMAAVGAVLLIACVNLANLQLARAVSRERELAVRAALGAGRERLARSALTDSLLLAMAGGSLGILLSFTGVRLFVAAAPASVPRLHEAHVSLPVLLVASGLSILTAILFGMLPALRAMRVQPQAAMQSSSNRAGASREGQRTRSLLVAGEVAFTVVLLILTGMLGRSFSRLLTQQRDFDADHVTLAEVHLFDPQYGSSSDNTSDPLRSAYIDRALAALTQLPGVKSSAVTTAMPMAGDTWINNIRRPDHPLAAADEPHANIRWVSPGYASTLKIPVLHGRDLTADDKNHPKNALISQQTALAAWPGEDPVGRVFESGGESYTVVGVVADARVNDLKKTANMVYLPYWDNPRWSLYFLVRSSQPAAGLDNSIRRALWNIDPNVPIPVVKSLDEQVSDSVATERFQTMVLATFGVTALFLALLGVYGVLAYSVSLRGTEFGIRIALGSGRSALVRLVLSQASVPVIGGVLAGLALAFAAVRSVKSLLYETSAVDPLVVGGAIALLLAAALLAALLPARRAASTDPMVALRSE